MSEPIRAPDLALYHYDGCVYCARVRDALRRLGVEVALRNIHADRSHRRALVEATGRATVPVLRISTDEGDRWLPESRDIIVYLYERFGEGQAPPVDGPSIDALGRWLPWMLLAAGGLSMPPLRGAFWALACGVAAARSLLAARRTGVLAHWVVGSVLVVAAIANALDAAGLGGFPWWYAAFAAVGLILLLPRVFRRPPRPS